MKLKDLMTAAALTGAGFAGGIFFEKYRNLKNTPESTITKLEKAKKENELASLKLDLSKRQVGVTLSPRNFLE